MDEGIGNSQSSPEQVDDEHQPALLDDEENMECDDQDLPRAEKNDDQTEECVVDRADVDGPLPEGWKLVYHATGLPMYYHEETGVVTHSKPFQLEGTVPDHEVPIAAIPCLFQKVMSDEMKQNNDVTLQDNECPISAERKQELLECSYGSRDTKCILLQFTACSENVMPTDESVASPRRERRSHRKSIESIVPRSSSKCRKRLVFVNSLMFYMFFGFFSQISERVNRYTRKERNVEKIEKYKNDRFLCESGYNITYDELRKDYDPQEIILEIGDGKVLIDFTPVLLSANGKKGNSKKPLLFDPMGKVALQLLNEFLQRLGGGQITYNHVDNKSSSYPYLVTASLTMKKSELDEMVGECRERLVVLCEIAEATGDSALISANVSSENKSFPIGSGVGKSIKEARQASAKDALSKLLPKLRINENWVCDGEIGDEEQRGFDEESKEIFKKVKIEQPNLLNICKAHGVPTPLSLLETAAKCSKRWAGRKIDFVKERVGDQISKVTLTFGDMQCQAKAIGTSEATNLACQLMLKQMHSGLVSYGALLDVYANVQKKSEMNRAKQQHDELVRVQEVENRTEPLLCIFEKLQEEMKKVNLKYPKQLLNQTPLPKQTSNHFSQTDVEPLLPSPMMAMHPVPLPPSMTHWLSNDVPRAQSSSRSIPPPSSSMDRWSPNHHPRAESSRRTLLPPPSNGHHSQHHSLPRPPPPPPPPSNNMPRHAQSSSRHQHGSYSSQSRNQDFPRKRSRWDNPPSSSSSYYSDRRPPL
ncbi:hypothetical protein CAEBREN_14904 [Caenorhabditis brenneri]|uniref:WW domain-containing protein n=1 Tax=Caenorhabditis brenneri TaxID=135651 RepID=G0MQH2_CAEBE|nr:hypothetical protein CAEBREN_14904 [Caenorhabditis brenneri]